ncbi:MAG TPA: hypothetical protein VM054_04190 [bacterium]|nr:hypothetical protein [bacterium]
MKKVLIGWLINELLERLIGPLTISTELLVFIVVFITAAEWLSRLGEKIHGSMYSGNARQASIHPAAPTTPRR